METKTVAIIQARMGSTRLPGKVLAEVCGKPLLQHMIERLDRCETIQEICVATPANSENAPIGEAIHNMGWNRWWPYVGWERDVLGRVLWVAQEVEADVIVELTADCPLIDPAIVDETVRRFQWGQTGVKTKLAFASTSRPALNPRNVKLAYSPGMDVRVFTTKTLESVDRLTKDPVDREHVSLYIWEHQRRFWCHDVVAPEELRDDVRLTVDTPEDLALVRAVFEHFSPRNDFSLSEILAFLNAQPVIKRLNAEVQQKAVR